MVHDRSAPIVTKMATSIPTVLQIVGPWESRYTFLPNLYYTLRIIHVDTCNIGVYPIPSNMDAYDIESTPFYCNPDTSVTLFKGFSRTRNHLPVVLKRHDFALIQQKEVQIRMIQTINAAIAQAKVQHPNACDIIEVQLKIERTNCSI